MMTLPIISYFNKQGAIELKPDSPYYKKVQELQKKIVENKNKAKEKETSLTRYFSSKLEEEKRNLLCEIV
jgi:hypothetical protein